MQIDADADGFSDISMLQYVNWHVDLPECWFANPRDSYSFLVVRVDTYLWAP